MDLTDKTVIVTGANAGIGRETARELARLKARVILACRNMEKGQAAADDITTSTGNHDVVVKPLDLASLKSVRAFAEDVLQTEPRLDILINNAGLVVQGQERTVTEDGLEVTLATNHLGHFLLTISLLPLLKRSAPSRVIVVSSLMYLYGHLDFDNLNGEKRYSSLGTYSNSKLANILFTGELARRLEGTGVTVNALHPGVVLSPIVENMNPIVRFAWHYPLRFLTSTVQKASRTSVLVATSDQLLNVTGGFFLFGRQTSLAPHAENRPVAKKLWQMSEQLVGLTHSGY